MNMKKLIFILVLASAFASCKESSKDQTSLSEYFAKQDQAFKQEMKKSSKLKALERNLIFGQSDLATIPKQKFYC